MESSSWPESLLSNRIKAIQKLTQGQPLTDKLQELLDLPEMIDFDLKSVDDTLVRILGMFDNTISILSPNLSNFSEIPHKQTHDMSFVNTLDDQRSEDSTTSVKSVKPIKTKRGCYKRRKNSSEFIRVTSTLIDDGHVWRKYGQKVILNSKHQRHYYRCTHKFDQGCQATKQVQMTHDEPPKYMTTYQGQHTCHNLQREHQIILDSPNPGEDSVFFSFETNSLIRGKQPCPFFSLTKHKHKEGFPSLSMKNNKHSSSNYYQTWDPVTQPSQVPLEPKSTMSVGLDLDREDMVLLDIDREDMVSSEVFSSTSSTHRYEIDDMLGSIDFGDFLSELCSHN